MPLDRIAARQTTTADPSSAVYERARLSRAQDNAPALRLAHVRLSRGGRVLLDGISLASERGTRTAVMGPNGAGKSLLLRLMKGLIAPDSGRVEIAGAPLDPARAQRIGLVLQRPVLLRRTVRANLDHALRAYGVPRAARPMRIEALLAMAGLMAQADRPARRLSGGEQQRLSIARALGAEPDILLLDEPTAALDPQATSRIERLATAAAASGVKVVFVTHDIGQARRIADEVVFLHQGRIAESAPASAFFERPASAEGRAYLDGRLLV